MGAALVAAMTACTLAIAAVTPMPRALAAAIAFLVVALGLEAMQRVALLRGPYAVRALRMQRNGEIEVECASGARHEGHIAPGCFVAPWLVVVRWRRSGARRDATVLLLPDMAPADALRRLRVLLRWSRGDP